MSRDKPDLKNVGAVSSTNLQEFEEPQSEWLTIEQALFSFAPNYLATDGDRHRALRSTAAEFFRCHNISFEFEDWGVDLDVIFCGVKFSIEDRCFFSASDLEDIEEDENSSDGPFKFWARGDGLKEFIDDITSRKVPSEYLRASLICRRLAEEIVRMYEVGFSEAVREGAAVVFARARSPLNLFKRVYPDQWRHFQVNDPEAGTAEGPSGERLFSVHVLPQEIPAQGGELAEFLRKGSANSSSAAAKAECKAWLIGLISASPNERSFTNDELWEQAVNRWKKRLSKNGFDKAYQAARDSVDAPAWSKTGPRKRGARLG